ncbi:MAG: PP2C family protein-serine/threonine phosphatase [Nitrospinota bacterium]
MKNYSYFAISDKGQIRKTNEDVFLADESLSLFAVADGVGGRAGGDLASAFIKEHFSKIVRNTLAKLSIEEVIFHSIVKLNEELLSEVKQVDSYYKNMSTTIISILLTDDGLANIGNLGDSRAYIIRGSGMTQLSKDHSLAQLLAENGSIDAKDVKGHPTSNRLTQYVGMPGSVTPETSQIYLQKNDLLLLCSDGLTNMLVDGEINDILQSSKNAQEGCETLIKRANELGARDNVTVIVVQWLADVERQNESLDSQTTINY